MGCCQSSEEYDSLDRDKASGGSSTWHSVPTVEYTRTRGGGGGPVISMPITPKILTTGRIDANEPDPDSVPLQTCEGPETSERLYTPMTELDPDAQVGAMDTLNTSFSPGAGGRRIRHTPRGSMDQNDPSNMDGNQQTNPRSNRSFQYAVTPKPGERPTSTKNGATPKPAVAGGATAAAPTPQSQVIQQTQPITRTASGLVQGLDRPSMIAEGVHKALVLYTGPNWAAFSDSSDVFAMVHPVDWSTLNAGRFKTVITPAAVLAIAKKNKVTLPAEALAGSGPAVRDIYDATLAVIADDDGSKPVKELNIFKYDTLLEDYQRLGPVDKSSNLVHLMYGSPVFGIAKRDAVVVVSRVALDDTLQKHYMLTPVATRMTVLSMLSSAGVPDRKGFQRSTVHCQGFIIRELPEGVEISMMLSAEPGGSIPLWLVDKLRGEQLKMVVTVRKLVVEALSKKK